jgi:ribosomal protein S27AE
MNVRHTDPTVKRLCSGRLQPTGEWISVDLSGGKAQRERCPICGANGLVDHGSRSDGAHYELRIHP